MLIRPLALFTLSIATALPAWAGSPCEHLAAPIQVLRFSEPIRVLRGFLPRGPVGEREADVVVDRMAAEDARGQLFRLEGLLRLYRGIYGRDLKPLLREVKSAEDALGQYTERQEYLAYAREIGAPARVLRHMERALAEAKATARGLLPELSKTLRRLEREVGETDWESQSADRESAIDEVRSELRTFADKEYDLSDLQGGVHELRRNLRWILIYVQALDGLILLEEGAGKLNEYSYLETHPIAQSRHSRIKPNPMVRRPARVPVTYFLALSKIVQELGEIKSSGENLEAVAEAYRESGAAASRADARRLAKRLAGKRADFVPDTKKAAKKVHKELERTGLLRKLRKWLKDEI